MTAQDTTAPQEAALPLSTLRPLWRQARAAWYGMSASSVFRSSVREEIARRTIAAQAQRIVSLQAAYDLRGTHLDAAQGRIETLENAIVMSGSVLRAIREEIEGE